MRRVWRLPKAGSLDWLRQEEEPLPPPGPGEARVRTEAIGLNFADVFACLGLYSATPKGPFIPGLECAGVIETIGSAPAHSLASGQGAAAGAAGGPAIGPGPGDRVMALTRFGGYATELNVDLRYLRPVPDGWSMAEGAAFPVQAITAWYGLVELGRLERDDVVLVHSAAGGVGLHALNVVARTRARAIATVGRSDKVRFLERARGLGPARIIVRDERSFGDALDAALQAVGARGLDLVFDAVAGPYFRPAFSRLRPEGRYVIYGAANFMPPGPRPNRARLALQYWRRPRLDPMALIDRNRAVAGFNLIYLFDKAERLPAAFAGVQALAEGPPHIGARFAFDDLPRALRALQSGTTVGKVIVEVSRS